MYIWLDARPSAKRLDSTASLRRAPSELLAAYRAGQSHEAPCPHGNCMPFAPRVFPGFEVVQFLFCGFGSFNIQVSSLRNCLEILRIGCCKLLQRPYVQDPF